MSTEKEVIEVAVEHPLEKVFNIESGTSTMAVVQRPTTEVAAIQAYDDKDKEIDTQLQEVYDAGMSAFENQFIEADQVDPRFKARSGEVAVQFLATALEAAKAKSTYKMHKDKLVATVSKAPSTVNNNLIVADRNELLKNLRDLNLEDAIVQQK